MIETREVFIPPLGLAGSLTVPSDARGLVVFVHGSGSSRLSPRNRMVAAAFADRGMATLLFDLLLPEEDGDRGKVFDIALLAGRLGDAIRFVDAEPTLADLPLGLFGASTGAAAAIVAAAELPDRVGAVVSRGGRPDLAGAALLRLRAPTLLIVGGDDHEVIALNTWARERIHAPAALAVVPGASHLFSERNALETVIDHAASWFDRHLASRPSQSPIALSG